MRRDPTANPHEGGEGMILENEAREAEAREDRRRAGLALHLAAAAAGVQPEDLRRVRGNPLACRARWLAFYLTHVACGWSLDRVGAAFGVNRTTAAAGCRWMEDARDRPELDEDLGRLERLFSDVFVRPVDLLS